MKKMFIVFALILMLFVPVRVNAEELDDSTIIKFESYPGGSLSNKRNLTFVWTSTSKMEDLIIKIYLPEEDKYLEVFNMSWDLEDEETEYDVEFIIINEPIDDPETPDIDETMGQTWTYKVTFPVVDQTLGVLKFVFNYNSGDKEYRNIFYMSNIVYPTPTPQPQPKPDDSNESNDNSSNNHEENSNNDQNKSTRLALNAAMFAAICSLLGTVLIIFSSQSKKNEDEEIL
jgi:hypothetical protein